MKKLILLILIIFFSVNAYCELVISEIMYNPPALMHGIKIKDFDYEWIELCNNSDKEINVNGYKISTGNSLYPDSALVYTIRDNIILSPYDYLVIARNKKVFDSSDKDFRAHYEPVKNIVGLNDYERVGNYLRLANRKCEVRLMDTSGNVIEKINYFHRKGWPFLASGKGGSLERINFNEDGNNPENWTSIKRFKSYGSPGKANNSDLTDDDVSVKLINNSFEQNKDSLLDLNIYNNSSDEIKKIEIEVSDAKITEQASIRKHNYGFKKKGISKIEFNDFNLSSKSTKKIKFNCGFYKFSNKTGDINVNVFFKNGKKSRITKKLKVFNKNDGNGLVSIFPQSLECGKFYKQPINIKIKNNGNKTLNQIKIIFPKDWKWSRKIESVNITESKKNNIKIDIKNNEKNVIVLKDCNLKPNNELNVNISEFRTSIFKRLKKHKENSFRILTSVKNGNLKRVNDVPFIKLEPRLIRANNIVINEIMFYPDVNKKQKNFNIWIKLYNPLNEKVNISGWKLYDNLPESNKEGVWIIPENINYEILPNQSFIICGDADHFIKKYNVKPDIEANNDNFIKKGKGKKKKKIYVKEKDNAVPNLIKIKNRNFSLSAMGDDVILVNKKGKIVDAVSWGGKSTLKMLGGNEIVCKKNQVLKRVRSGYQTIEANNDPLNEIISNSFIVE
jgi:hypothetical protein